MPSERFSYTREQIYEAVWAEPMRDACKKFNITDVGLAKVCRRLNVPRPKQGYWVRVSIGQSPPKKPLPPPVAGAPAVFEGSRSVEPPPDPAVGKEQPPPRDPTLNQPIPVPETLGELHPAIRASMPALQHPTWKRHEGCPRVAIDVSPPQLDRALRIMNALFLALDARGLRVEVTEPKVEMRQYGGNQSIPSRTGAHVGDSFVEFELSEDHDVVAIPPPKPAKTRPPSIFPRPLYSPRPTHEDRPNGRFVLRILSESYGLQRKWADGARGQVEKRLHQVVEVILRTAEEMRLARIEAERREREWQETARRRREEEKQQWEEEARVKDLAKTLAAWREVCDIRAYVDEARSIVAAAGLKIRSGSWLDEFVRWATARADQVDPLRELREEIAERTRGSAAQPRDDAPPVVKEWGGPSTPTSDDEQASGSGV